MRRRLFDSLACMASVSNRVIARKLERHSFFFWSCPSFLDEPREETLPTQAIDSLTPSLTLSLVKPGLASFRMILT